MGRRRAPSYWWDFNQPGEDPINVESDADWLPDPIASFWGPTAIAQAERLIRDLEAGRVDPRRVNSQR